MACGKTRIMNQPFIVRVHSLKSLDDSASLGVLATRNHPVHFGRASGVQVDQVTIEVAMLGSDRSANPTVSSWAGTVFIDHLGRPWVENASNSHDIYCRAWPHTRAEALAMKIESAGTEQVAPRTKLLTEGWWWISVGRRRRDGWVLISVEPSSQQRRTGPVPITGSRKRDTKEQEPEPVYSLGRETIEVFVSYFIDWFALPPEPSPRVRTGREANDPRDRGRERIVRALAKNAQGARGLLNSDLLVRAVDEGDLTFVDVYRALANLGHI